LLDVYPVDLLPSFFFALELSTSLLKNIKDFSHVILSLTYHFVRTHHPVPFSSVQSKIQQPPYGVLTSLATLLIYFAV
jgi:hypothetical protein